MDLHHLFPIFGIKSHLFRLNFSRQHLTNLFFVYATLMIWNTSIHRIEYVNNRWGITLENPLEQAGRQNRHVLSQHLCNQHRVRRLS